ncbi:MAG: hypothetical protein ACM3OB_10775 [Acidobacteriota bacterium]
MADPDLERVRGELQRMGYLTHGLERVLLQDALRPPTPGRALLLLALREGALAGVLVAAVGAFALAVANRSLTTSPFDVVPLFVHLLLPGVLLAAAGFALLGGLLALVLRLAGRRSLRGTSTAIALLVTAAAAVVAYGHALGLIAEAGMAARLGFGLGAAAAALLLLRLLRGGLLALAVRLTDRAPLGRPLDRRVVVGLGAVASALFLVPALLLARGGSPAPPEVLPSRPGERVLLVGVDGVLPQEFDYLLQHGDLPEIARLTELAGVTRYRRESEPPAAFWTSVATGLRSPLHGVASLDSFRPLGTATPLEQVGVSRAWWSRVEAPLGLVEYRPLLANRRRAPTLWELAARGGAPVLAVDWWATYPAEPLPGLVLAHGAYQLLGERTAGAMAPESERGAIEAVREKTDAGDFAAALQAGLPADAARAVLDKALLPDAFYLDVFARRLAAASPPRAAALYLPGLDIAADGWRGSGVAFADLVRLELVAVDHLLANGLRGVGTVALVLDPGRRGGAEGRIVLWRAGGCRDVPAADRRIAPEQVAAALLRALGLPQSAELPEPPAGCAWEPAPARVPTYGQRAPGRVPAIDSQEYLQNLRSLGYL